MNAPTNTRSRVNHQPSAGLVVLAALIGALTVALLFWEALPFFFDLDPDGILAVGAGLVTFVAMLVIGFDRRFKRMAHLVAKEIYE